VGAVATATGVNSTAIQQFVTNWTNFFTANPSAHVGLTVTQAAYGAAFGDAIGVALTNPTSANLQTVVSTTQGQAPVQFSPNTIAGFVANALIDVATGQYQTGVALGALPAHTPLQGEFNITANGVFLTQNIDTPTSGFAGGPNGTPLLNGFTATAKDTVFNALPFVTPLGLANNTLNSGDNLQTTGAATGATTLNFTTTGAAAANPAFANNVTMNGVNQLNITNAFAGVGGFRGDITGLLKESNTNSNGPVVLGGIGQGLKTLLTDISVSGFGGPNGSVINAVVLATALGDATKNLNVNLSGTLGARTAGGADIFIVGNDTGGGTAGTPNLTYGTMTITAANQTNLQLQNGGGPLPAAGVDGLQNLVLKGAGDIALGQDAPGNHQLLKSIDSSAATGSVFLTGASAGNASNAEGTGGGGANPAWLFGSAVGLLNDNVAGNPFALTSVVLGAGLTVLDVSSATVAQMAALKTGAGTGITTNPNDEIIVNSAVADTTSAATFANIKGFSIVGVGGAAAAGNANGAGGTMNMANLPGFNTIIYKTAAQNGAAGTNTQLTVNNGPGTLTVNAENNTGAPSSLVVNGPGGISDTFNLIMGNLPQNAVDTLGTAAAVAIAANINGYELVTLTSLGGTSAGTNNLGYVQLTPTIGGPEQVTIAGDHNITIGNAAGVGMGGIADVRGGLLELNNLRIIDTDTGVTRLVGANQANASPLSFTAPNDVVSLGSQHPYSTNAVFIDASTSGGFIMQAGDANVGAGTNNQIKGATGFGNVLGGSIGKDTFTASTSDVSNTIYTDGGADSITLPGSHTTSQHIGLYVGVNNTNAGGVVPGAAELGQAGSLTNINDIPRIGFWGSAFGTTPTGHAGGTYNGLANGTGTSASQAIIAGGANAFVPGTDVLDFAAGAWAILGANHGLTAGNLVSGSIPIVALPGFTAATSQMILPSVGAVAANSVAAGTNLILLDGVFANANQVAQTLIAVTGNVHFAGALAPANSAHMLVAYNDGSGSTHIADMDLFNPFGIGLSDTNTLAVHVSDMVQLTGVSFASFSANANASVHFVATT
jgi:hypothetical protein